MCPMLFEFSNLKSLIFHCVNKSLLNDFYMKTLRKGVMTSHEILMNNNITQKSHFSNILIKFL